MPKGQADDRHALSLLEGLIQEARTLVSNLRQAHAAAYALGNAEERERSSTTSPLHRSAFGVRMMLRLRNTRALIFGTTDLFQDPAWDILLDLYAADLEGRPVSISSACIASMVPPSTALRWIKVLEKHGLVTRGQDETDARRKYLMLTDKSREALERFMESVEAGLDEIIATQAARLQPRSG